MLRDRTVAVFRKMIDQSLITPLKDKLQYRELKLSNGFRVLLVSDPTTEKAAAAVNVRQLLDFAFARDQTGCMVPHVFSVVFSY